MQALKVLVIAMGVLIVLGAGLVAVTLYKRGMHMAGAPEGVGVGGVAAGGFGTKRIALPPGASLKQVKAEGDRLIAEIALADGSQAVMVVDLRDGSVLGTLEFAPDKLEPGQPAPNASAPSP